jgi:hypothetical protein
MLAVSKNSPFLFSNVSGELASKIIALTPFCVLAAGHLAMSSQHRNGGLGHHGGTSGSPSGVASLANNNLDMDMMDMRHCLNKVSC